MAATSKSVKYAVINPPRLKDYVLTDRLGSGTYATVYKAYKKSSEVREVLAVKCIEKRSLNHASIENLLVEIEILKQIKNEHIVRLINFEWDDTHIFLIMEYCGGGDLSTFIQARRMIPEFTVKRFLQQIASALKLLHEHNISHLDLKPQNILLTSYQHPVLKLGDFGFAQYLESSTNFSLRGSPLYMAPEMILHHRYDAKVDLWSVGVILYESLFGHAPFASRSFDELEVKIKSDQPIEIPTSPHVSDACHDLLVRLLQRDPNQRISFEDFFSHPFVDLEHKPSKECLPKATPLVNQAVQQDKNGKTTEAINSYLQAVDYLVPAIYHERDPRKKEALRDKVKEYCNRIEQLKTSIKPKPSNTGKSSMERLKRLAEDRPELLCGLELITAARANEESENFSESVKLYTSSLAKLLPILSDETDLEAKELIGKVVEHALQRAEVIKEYEKIHKVNEVTSHSIDEAEQWHSKCTLQ